MLATPFLAEAGSLGAHGAHGGIVYTGRAGFVDVGHTRDVTDLVAFAYQQIHAAAGVPGTRIATSEGEATLTGAVAPREWLEVARSIAFDDALGHEILTYWVGRCGTLIPAPGAHNSAFSPEDLCSNHLGTVVAQRALMAGGTFATEAERALQALLTDLDAQPIAETRRAFGLVDRRWIDPATTFTDNCYLRRRNFGRTPFRAGHHSDAASPPYVTTPYVFTATYDYVHTKILPVVFARTFTRGDFPTEIAAIRANAQALYGPDFDRA